MDRPVRRYADNAVAMWSSLAPGCARVLPSPPGLAAIAVPGHGVTRVIARRPVEPSAVRALLATRPSYPGRISIEDPFDTMDRALGDVLATNRTPVMVRPAVGPAVGSEPAPPKGVMVSQVRAPGDLADAERVIVDGYPRPSLQPWTRGRALPPLLLRLRGWRIWLATYQREPAAACYTYDDGRSVGVYWLATLPGYRSRGIGRAIMKAVLAAYPHRTAVLASSAMGEALYASLGFRTVASMAWYRERR